MSTSATTAPAADLDQLADQIRTAHEAAAGGSLESARDVGRLLLAAKSLCDRGRWLPWLEANCPDVGTRQVQKYMKLAQHWDQVALRAGRDSHLSIEGALRLLSADDTADDAQPDAPDDEPEFEEEPDGEPEPEYESAEAEGEEATTADFAEQLAWVAAFAGTLGADPPPVEERADLVRSMEGTARTLLGAAGRLRNRV